MRRTAGGRRRTSLHAAGGDNFEAAAMAALDQIADPMRPRAGKSDGAAAVPKWLEAAVC